MPFHAVTPILRSFDEAKAREFYVDFLGFTVDFEHRFEPGTPLYMGISRDACLIHLSEHHGDGTPGTTVRIRCDELDAYLAALTAAAYKHYRPAIQQQPWGRDMSVQDGAGNKLVFFDDRTATSPT